MKFNICTRNFYTVEIKGETHFDLRGPNFRLLPKEPEFQPKKGNFYVGIQDGILHYKIISLSGEAVSASIPLYQLSCKLERLDTIQSLRPYIHSILRITSARQHTHPQALICALSMCVEQRENLSDPIFETYWCQKVGMAQRDVPAVIASEYCKREANNFCSSMNFFKKNKSYRTFHFRDQRTNLNTSWFPLISSNRLGIEFAVLRSGNGREALGVKDLMSEYMVEQVQITVDMLRELDQSNAKKIKSLRTLLSTALSRPDNHSNGITSP